MNMQYVYLAFSICEYIAEGHSQKETAEEFRCSQRKVTEMTKLAARYKTEYILKVKLGYLKAAKRAKEQKIST